MPVDYKTQETEVATLVNQAKTLYAEIASKGADAPQEDRDKLTKLVEDGQRKRAELDTLKGLSALDDVTNAHPGERKVNDALDVVNGRSGGHARKSWGDMVIESEQLKVAKMTRELPRVDVGEIKVLVAGTTTFGGVAIDNQFLPDILDIARQRPRSVIDLVGKSRTGVDAVEYIIMDTRNGGVVSVTITAQGSGYTSSSTVTFGAAPAGGVTATGVPIVVAGAITGVTITNPGSGYVTPPSVTFAVAGTGAAGTAVLGGAAVVGEYSAGQFGLKPESGMTFALQTANVKTIATWIAASRQILDDAPRLRALIDNELQYMVELALEDQIIKGDGTGNNFTGILNTSGIQSRVHKVSGRGFVATDNDADTIRRAITDIYLAFYQPDGIVLNPAQGETLELTRASTAGTYMMTYDPVAMKLWRVPVVETAAMTAGTALVGNFGLGATLWDRMATQILTGQPNDFFLRNAFAILAELRAAFAVVRPLAFEKATGMD